MAMTTVPSFAVPPPWAIPTGGASVASMTLNASGDRAAFIIACPKAGTLEKFEFRTGAVANNPDNGIRLSFQDVDVTTGNPDGTQDQYRDITGTISANTWQVPGLMTSDGTDTGTKRTVAAGELVACVVDFVSFVASDSFTVQYISSAIAARSNWYVDDGSAGSWVKQQLWWPILALKYDDGTYAEFPYPAWPTFALNTTVYNNGSTPDERALRFQVPVSMRTTGAYVCMDADGVCDLVLYDGSDTVLGTISFDPDIRNLANANWHMGLFDAGPVTLLANTTYRLSLKPTSSTSLTGYDMQVDSNALMAAIPGGVEWYLSTRTDAGAWSDTTTKRLMAGLFFDGVDTGGSGGGGGGFPFFG